MSDVPSAIAGPESETEGPPEPSEGAPRGGPDPSLVPLGIKLAYGAPSFAGAAMAIPIGIHLTIFYSDVVLVPLGWIAMAKAISRAFDALTDPLMGWASDRTRSRWGRRRPYLALGAPTCALAFLALFSPPEALSPSAAASWLLVTYILYYLFHTVYVIPHYGLGPELTQDYHERSRLYGVQEAFTVGGTMVAAILPGVLEDTFDLGPRTSLTVFAVVFGGLLTLLYWNLVARVHERRDFVERAPNPLVPGVRRVMRNRVFRILLVVYLVGSVTGAIPGMMMPYFTTYVLRPENPGTWLAVFLALYFGAGLLGLPFWVWFARRFGKKTAYLVTFVPGTIASTLIFFLGEGQLLETAIILVFAGSVFGARLFLGPALQADVIDYDELHTGKRREAQFGSLWSVMTKFTVIPSMSIPLAVLASLGYQPNAEQSETVTLAIRAIFGLAPAATSLLALVIALRFPITQEVHERVWEGIRRHRQGLSATDPVTGGVLAPPSGRDVDEETGWFLDHFSRRELRAYLTGGPDRLVRGAALQVALCAALTAAAGSSVFFTVSDLRTDPGLQAVLEVVAAGFALTGLVFHAVRLRAALHMRRRPVARGDVELHLAAMVRGGAPGPVPVR